MTVRVSWMGWSYSDWPVEDAALSEIVIVEVPEGVISGRGGAMAALPPPQPEKLIATEKMTAERAAPRARRLLRVAGWKACRFLTESANKKRRTSKIGVGRGTREMGGTRSGAAGGI